jgi:hypothetical protein
VTDRSTRRARRLLAVLVLGSAALVRPFAVAAAGDEVCEKVWTGAVDSSWHTAGNWLPDGEPTADDDACIQLPGATVTVGPDAPAVAASLQLGLPLAPENPTLAVDGQTLALGAGGRVEAGATLTLTSSAPLGADAAVTTGGALVNEGTVRADPGTGGGRRLGGPVTNANALAVAAPLAYGGTSDLTNTGTVTVSSGASLCVCGDAGTTPGLVNSTGALANGGTVTVSAARMTQGTGANTGFAVDVRGSTLTLAGDGAAGFLVQGGTTTLHGDVGLHQNLTALAGAAAGNVTLAVPDDTTNAGTIFLRSTDPARRASLVVGTTTAPASLANTGSLRVVAGANAGHRIIGQVTNTGTVSVNGDAVLGGTLDNHGTLTVGSEVTLTVGAAASVVNGTGGAVAATGRLVVASGGEWEQGAGTSTGDVLLAAGGDLALTGPGAGQFVAEGPGEIAGDLAAGQSLILSAGAARGVPRSFTNAGALTLVAAGTTTTSLSLPTGGVLTNTGTLRSFRLPGSPPAARIAGRVESSGTLDVQHALTVDGTVVNGGTVAVDTSAVLTTTAYEQSSTGVLEVEVTSATSFGRLTTGAATLAGTLHALVTYTPPASTAFGVLAHTTRTGTFGTIDVGTSGFTVRYDPAAVTLVSPDRPPTADAGADTSVSSGAAFTLDGRASHDPEGGPLTYLWETTSAAVIRDPASAVTSVDGRTGPTTLTFHLTVTDGAGGTGHDDVVVTVRSK